MARTENVNTADTAARYATGRTKRADRCRSAVERTKAQDDEARQPGVVALGCGLLLDLQPALEAAHPSRVSPLFSCADPQNAQRKKSKKTWADTLSRADFGGARRVRIAASEADPGKA